MAILPPSAEKHDLSGIGGASAATVLAALAAYPPTAALAQGVQGKIIYWALQNIFTWFASIGLVLLNVGAEKLLIAIEKSQFDGSMEAGYKLIEEIRSSGRDLTPEEIKKIDDEVIEQFRKFAKMTRKR